MYWMAGITYILAVGLVVLHGVGHVAASALSFSTVAQIHRNWPATTQVDSSTPLGRCLLTYLSEYASIDSVSLADKSNIVRALQQGCLAGIQGGRNTLCATACQVFKTNDRKGALQELFYFCVEGCVHATKPA